MDNVYGLFSIVYYERMETKTKRTPKPDARTLGYMSIRISKKAYQELMKRAIADKRTMVAELEVILGV